MAKQTRATKTRRFGAKEKILRDLCNTVNPIDLASAFWMVSPLGEHDFIVRVGRGETVVLAKTGLWRDSRVGMSGDNVLGMIAAYTAVTPAKLEQVVAKLRGKGS
ncbi:MAG: hypothetical protein ABII00_10215 [Elusimicrobiota bacterium]